jgi:hypothetical protein
MKTRLRQFVPEFGFTCVLLLLTYLLQFSKENWEYQVISSDGRGYYAYLPALFLQKDHTFQQTANVEAQSYANAVQQHYLHLDAEGQSFNKYYPGFAVLQSPFFATACVVSKVTGRPVTGYTKLFHVFVLLGSVFYAVVGFWFFRKYLELQFGNKRWSLVIAALVFFGTNVFYYVIKYPSMGHGYSFALFAAFAYFVVRYSREYRGRQALALGLILGIIFLLRPTNLLIVLAIPFLLGFATATRSFFRKLFQLKNGHVLLGVIAFGSMASLLFLLWKWQTGHWIIWSYQGEGFNFSDPEFLKTLWSYRTGVLLLLPLTLLATIGAVRMTFQNRFQGISWFVYMVVLTYLTSSWWCWDYAGSFGHRIYVEHWVFLGMPLFVLLSQVRWKKLAMAAVSLAVLMNTARAYQLNEDIITLQRFNADTYWKSLLAFNRAASGTFYSFVQCQPFGIAKRTWKTPVTAPNQTLDILPENEFSCSVDFAYPADRENHKFFFKASFDKFRDEDVPIDNIFWVIDATDTLTGKRSYMAYPFYEYKGEAAGCWKHLVIESEVEDTQSEFHVAKLYLWNPGKNKLSLRNVTVDIREFVAP